MSISTVRGKGRQYNFLTPADRQFTKAREAVSLRRKPEISLAGKGPKPNKAIGEAVAPRNL